MRRYRRNSDADLREIERDYLAQSSFDNLHRYVNALYRSGEVIRALNITDNIVNSNDRGALDDFFKNKAFLSVLKDYSRNLLDRSAVDVAVGFGSATISIRRNIKKKQLAPFWKINFSFDLRFEGEDYNHLETTDIDEDLENPDGWTAVSYAEDVQGELEELDERLTESWELKEDSSAGNWSIDIDTEDVEDHNAAEDGYQLLDSGEIVLESADLTDFEAHFENLDVGEELTVRATDTFREGDADFEVTYDVTLTRQMQPEHLLAILIGFTG